MCEDAIERWHQIRTRHNDRIRSLRSKEKQKCNIAKHEHASNNIKFNNVISEVKTKTKRNFKNRTNNAIKKSDHDRKKAARETTRARVKTEVENESRIVLPTNRDRLKQEHEENHPEEHKEGNPE